MAQSNDGQQESKVNDPPLDEVALNTAVAETRRKIRDEDRDKMHLFKQRVTLDPACVKDPLHPFIAAQERWAYNHLFPQKPYSWRVKIMRFSAEVLYEIYIYIGFLMILSWMFWVKTTPLEPIRNHLLPHILAYALSALIKHILKKWKYPLTKTCRPACVDVKVLGDQTKTNLEIYQGVIGKSHCNQAKCAESLPSGHAMVGSSMYAAAMLSLWRTSPDNWFHDKLVAKILLTTFGAIVYVMVLFHRVTFGYHHPSDVAVGVVLGTVVGMSSYMLIPQNVVSEMTSVLTQQKRSNVMAIMVFRKTVSVLFILLAIYKFYEIVYEYEPVH
jgi:membrane-associated phospholipid phosphatase